MAIQLTQRLIKAEEYRKMAEAGILSDDGRIELLEGKLVEMSPAGRKHAAMVKRLTALLYRKLKGELIISVQDPIRLGEFSEPEPDLALLKPSATYYEDRLPDADDVLLIIEVSDSSLDKDREVKLPIYAAANIPEYWIINMEACEIEAYRFPREGTYQSREVLKTGDTLSLPVPGCSFSVDDIFG